MCDPYEDAEQILDFLRNPQLPAGIRYNNYRFFVDKTTLQIVVELINPEPVPTKPPKKVCAPFVSYLEEQVSLYKQYKESLTDFVYVMHSKDGTLWVKSETGSIVFSNSRGAVSYKTLTKKLESEFLSSKTHKIRIRGEES